MYGCDSGHAAVCVTCSELFCREGAIVARFGPTGSASVVTP